MALGLLFLGIGGGLALGEGKWGKLKENEEIVQVSRSESDSKIVFEVAGAVMRPGVYELEEGSRWKAGLVEAGGLAEEADREWVEKNVNLAREIGDGEKLRVLRAGEILGVRDEEGRAETEVGIINLNTGSQGELESLPGVGPALAGRILEYREKQGGFKSIEEIKLVSGIGDKLFEEIKEKIGI